MVTVYDVDSQKYLDELTKEMQKFEKLKAPDWSLMVKTGRHTANPPVQQDFWYRRAASILRNLYIHGPKGVSRLRVKYGGLKKRGTREEKRFKGGGKIIRTIFQQLEAEGMLSKVMKQNRKGRQLTSKAVKLLDNLAFKVYKGDKV